MFYKSIIYITFGFLCFLLHSCANIVPLSGGLKDTQPPKLLKSIPKNGQVNYSNNTIDLYFNENVDAENITESLIISPLIDDNYSTIVKKNRVSLKFNKPFLSNTTYNFYFGECIKDITEKNPTNLNLSFSTGPYIDSLFIKGQVINHEQKKPVSNASVSLYLYNDTLDIKKAKPLYYTKANSSGNYMLKNVKAGTYKMYALVDGNKNFLYDNENELIAYKDSVVLDSSMNSVTLSLSKLDTKKPKILNDNSLSFYHVISFNEGLKKAVVLYEKDTLPTVLFELNKRMKVFNLVKNIKDSISYEVIAIDSMGNILEEKYKILYKEKEETKKNKITNYTYAVTPSNYLLAENEKIVFTFDSPIDKINYDSLFIKSDAKKTPLNNYNISLSNHNLKFTIDKYDKFKDSLIIYFNKAAFINSNNDSSYHSKMFFKKKNEEAYGTISGKILCEKPHYIFQLLDNSYKVVKNEKDIKTFSYRYLDPGTYYLRIIIDDNNNGILDLLDLTSGKQPEEVIYYKETINLRANWDIEDIKFNVSNK